MDYITFIDHRCQECGFDCRNKRVFGIHLSKHHPRLTFKQYVIKHAYAGNEPLCACGCGQLSPWQHVMYRFAEYCHGHNAKSIVAKQKKLTPEQLAKRGEAIRAGHARKKVQKQIAAVESALIERETSKEELIKTIDINIDTKQIFSVDSIIENLDIMTPIAQMAAINDAVSVYDSEEIIPYVERRVVELSTETANNVSLMRNALAIIAEATGISTDPSLVNDDLPKLINDNHSIISRGTLARMLRDGRKDDIKNHLLPAVRQFFNAHVAAHGWFYPTSNEQLSHVIKQLRRREIISNRDSFSSLSTIGGSFLKSIFRSYWDVDSGPSKSFNNPKKLDAVLGYRLGLNDSKPYTYDLCNGEVITCNEVFDINIKNVRFGFVVQRSAVSWFKPSAATDIYRRFLGDKKEPIVWDPSMGFGARMLGFAAAYPSGHYIGTDPATQTFRDLLTLRDMLEKELFNEGFDAGELYCVGSEKFKLSDKIDLMMTSPAYYDKECYFDEPGQCWRDYKDEESWVNNYLTPTLQTASDALSDDGHVVINIDDKHAPLVIRAALDAGLRHADTMKLMIGRDHFAKKNGHNEIGKSEPILVFKR